MLRTAPDDVLKKYLSINLARFFPWALCINFLYNSAFNTSRKATAVLRFLIVS